MLLNLLGWFYIVLGVVILLKPKEMRDKCRKTDMKKLKQFFSALALIIGLFLIRATWGLEGLLANVFLFFGFVALAKAVYLFKGKSADKVLQWWLDKDLNFFRVSAIVEIIVGGLLLSM